MSIYTWQAIPHFQSLPTFCSQVCFRKRTEVPVACGVIAAGSSTSRTCLGRVIA